MNERELVDVLMDVLEGASIGELVSGEPGARASLRTFRDVGLLTKNEGFVLRVRTDEHGSDAEYQIQVVRSR